MDAISPTVVNLIIFVLAIYVGYHVVWNVTPALHTPLMAVTNAISAIVIVGAMLAAALTVTPLGKFMGVLAVALAAVNVFGGFLVGFGTRYAGGCTSGHAIMGISSLQWPSLVATIFFMIGGFLMTHVLLEPLMKLVGF